MLSSPWGHLWPFFLLLFSFGSAQWFLPFFQFIQQCITFIILISLISLCITVIYVPVLSPLLGTMRVRIRTEIWLISYLRAPSIVISTINTVQWLDACDPCLPVEATARLWPSVGGLQGSVLGGGRDLSLETGLPLTNASVGSDLTLIWHFCSLFPVWIFPLLCSISPLCHFCL